MDLPEDANIQPHHRPILQAIEQAIKGKDFAEIDIQITITDPKKMPRPPYFSHEDLEPDTTKLNIYGSPGGLEIVAFQAKKEA